MKDQVARTAAIVALLLASCTQISAEPFAATSAVAAPMDSEREISARHTHHHGFAERGRRPRRCQPDGRRIALQRFQPEC